MVRPSNRQRTMTEKETTLNHAQSPGNSDLGISDIVWKGDAWTCINQLKHYPSFRTQGVDIDVSSFVYVMGEEKREFVAYVEDLYENQHSMKMVKVRWFASPKDVMDLPAGMETHDREVLMTSNIQGIRAECINGVASVLTPKDFEKCLRVLKRAEVFVCHRELTNRNVKDFPLSHLHGYSIQPILASLKRVQKLRTLTQGDLSAVHEPQSRFRVNDNVELLSHDSGMRGCWFRCKILSVAQKRFKVQYYDVLDVDGPQKLEEWVPSSRVASPDQLGTRLVGRPSIRPWPSKDTLEPTAFEAGSAVDVFCNNGWWEGVMIGYQTSALNNLQVYFPGEKMFLTIERKNIRVSKDWIDGKWVNIKPKRDILSHFSILNPMSKLQPLPNRAGASTSTPVQRNSCSTVIHQRPKDSSASTSKSAEQETKDYEIS